MSMGKHRSVPGRFHRRATPNFWRHAVAYRQRKAKSLRHAKGVTVAELRERDAKSARARSTMLALGRRGT